MPYYVSIDSDIVPRFRDAQIEISDTSEPSLGEVEAIVDAAEGQLHAYLRNRYSVPLMDAEAKKLAKQIVASLVCFRVFTLAYPQAASNPFLEEARSAERTLRDLADGTASLPNANGALSATPETTFGTEDKLFAIGDVL